MPHSHDVDVYAVEAAKLKLKMRDKVRIVGAKPGQVLAAELHRAHIETRLAAGRVDSTRRNLRRSVVKIYRCDIYLIARLQNIVLIERFSKINLQYIIN